MVQYTVSDNGNIYMNSAKKRKAWQFLKKNQKKIRQTMRTHENKEVRMHAHTAHLIPILVKAGDPFQDIKLLSNMKVYSKFNM